MAPSSRSGIKRPVRVLADRVRPEQLEVELRRVELRQRRLVEACADGDELPAVLRDKLRDLEDERRRLRHELDGARAAVPSEYAVAAAIRRSLEQVLAAMLRGDPAVARDALRGLVGGEPLRVVRAGATSSKGRSKLETGGPEQGRRSRQVAGASNARTYGAPLLPLPLPVLGELRLAS